MRLENLFLAYPWCLLGARHASEDSRQQMFQEFYDLHPCCLDEQFGQWFRATLHRAEDLDSHLHRMLFTTLARHLRATNMHIEGLLNQIRQSAPQGKKKVSPEKYHHLGLLSQLLARHCEEDKAYGNRVQLSDMVKAGLPLQARR